MLWHKKYFANTAHPNLIWYEGPFKDVEVSENDAPDWTLSRFKKRDGKNLDNVVKKLKERLWMKWENLKWNLIFVQLS
jgi:hypothetical protein